MKKRIPQLDFIKGIAIILVVMGHVVSQVWSTIPEIYENSLIFRFCYSFHMPLFVFISGWICRMTMKKDLHWFIRRLKRIGIPYIIITAIVFFMLRKGDILQFIRNIPYWYLVFILIADSILYIGIKSDQGIKIFAPAYALILISAAIIPHNIAILRQLADFIPFYAAGAVMPVISARIKKHKFPILIVLGGLYFAIFPFYRHGIGSQTEYIKKFTANGELAPFIRVFIIIVNKFAVPIAGIAMIFLLTELLYSSKIARKLKLALQNTGNHTMAIYLLHDMFFVRITENAALNSVISANAGFFIPLILSHFYIKFKKKLRK